MCTYGKRTYRLMDWGQTGHMEFVSVRVFHSLEEARAYRDAEYPGARVWLYVGNDGYLIHDEETGRSFAPPDDSNPQFMYSGRIPRGGA